MTHQSSSPLLIKRIDGIVNRSPNVINYSILNGKRVEREWKQENNQEMKYIKNTKYGLKKRGKYCVKQEENTGKRKI